VQLISKEASRLSAIKIAEILPNGDIKILRHIYFKCTGCAQCCKDNYIPVTEEDLEILTSNGYEIDQILEDLSPVLIPKGDNQYFKAYLLRKKPFINECIFLDTDNACKVHSFKPMSCKIYPFAIKEEDNRVFITIHPSNVCKYIELDVKEEDSNTIEVVKEILFHIRQREDFKLKKLNKRVSTGD